MGRLSFAISIPLLMLGVAVLALAGWLAFQNWRRHRESRLMPWLEAFRWIIIATLFVTLCRPEWVTSVRPKTQPEVLVLRDASRSMTTKDVLIDQTTVRTREEWLQEQLDSEFWKPLATEFKVTVQDFSPTPTGVVAAVSAATGTNEPLGTAATTPDAPDLEEGTDLNRALEDASLARRNLRAILLLSDGDWNLGKSPVVAATKLQMQNLPVFAIGVGSDRHLPDIEIASVAAPSYGLVGEQVFIPFTVQSYLSREVHTTVTLYGDGRTQAAKDIVLPPMGQVQDALFWMPSREGTSILSVRVPTEADEIRADNNEHGFGIAVRAETLKVLVVDSLPRWEYRYLRNALQRDPGVQAKCLLFHPALKAGGGRDYLDAFPKTKEALSPFDVVFLGDVGIGEGELSLQDAELLKGLVEQQGSGLVFIPGARGRQATFQASAMADLMPVVLDPGKANGIGTATPSQLSLTRLGRGHLLTMLAVTEDQNARLWQNLPGFYWSAAVEKSKPGSEVLAVHDSYRNQWGKVPLLVTRPAGNGKTLFLGIDSAWRWRRGVEDTYHYRFWGQVVRWMSYQRHLAHDQGFRLLLTPDNPQKGETVTMNATVFAQGGFPVSDGHVTAEIVGPGGKTERLSLAAVAGGWGMYHGQFTPQQRGKFRVKVHCEETGRDMETELQVRGEVREQVGRPAQVEVLREIVQITRGQLGSPKDLADFVKKIGTLPEPPPVERRLRIWCHPLWGGLIVVLLAAYWIGRKLAGLI